MEVKIKIQNYFKKDKNRFLKNYLKIMLENFFVMKKLNSF